MLPNSFMGADGGARTIRLKVEGVFDARGGDSPKTWLRQIQKDYEKAAKETLEYQVARIKDERKEREVEAKRQQKIADDFLRYKIDAAKKATAAEAKMHRDLERQLAVDLKRSADLHNQTNTLINKSAKAATDFRIREMKRENDARLAEAKRAAGANTGSGETTGNILSQVFAGSFIGTLAGGGVLGAINALVTGIGSTANAIKDLGVRSLKLAGDFQISVNAMRVFTGSTAAAKSEIAEMDALARDTPGLRMIDAEQGAVRLRALGFEAKVAQDFVVGLAKHKLLSGAGEDSIQRVIVNLTQLATGSPRMSQDIKEMILNVPTLRNAMIETFGSLEKFKAELERDPDNALKKFAIGLRESKTASAGLNDGLGKLEDSLISAGRAFGEPLVDPLTDAIKDLTGYVNENRTAVASWGQSTSDWLRGVTNWWKELSAAREERKQSGVIKAANDFTDSLFGGGQEQRLRDLAKVNGKTYEEFIAGTGSESFEQAGARLRKQKEKERFALFGSQNPKTLENLANRGYTVDFSSKLNDDELAAVARDRDRKKAAEDERARLREITQSQTFHDRDLAILNDSLAIKEARIDSHLRYTLQQEMQFQMQQQTVRRVGLQAEVMMQKSFYARQIQLADGNKNEILQLESERDKVLSGLNRRMLENELQSQKRIAELQKQAVEQKRQALIELKNIQITGTSFDRDTTSFGIERAISKQVGGAESDFRRLITVTNDAYQTTARLTRESFALQIQDQSLTAEQRVNIEAKMHLDLRQLAQTNAKTLIEIEDRRHAKVLENMRFQREVASEQFRYSSSRAEAIQGAFFNPENFNSQLLMQFNDSVMGGDLRRRHDEANAKRRTAYARLAEGQNPDLKLTSDGIALLVKEVEKANAVADPLFAELLKLEESIPGNYHNFLKLADAVGVKNVRAFDELSKAILKHRQTLEKADAQSEIDYYSSLVAIEKARGSEADHNKLREYNFQLEKARRRSEKLDLDQLTAANANYSNSLDGLREKLKGLLGADDKAKAGVAYGAQKQLIQERIGLAQENILLEERIAAVGLDSAERYRRAWLGAIFDVRDANIKANEEIIRANVRLDDARVYHSEQAKAKILGHLAEQKTQTDLVADAFIEAFDLAAKGIDKAFGKVGDIPILGNLLKGQAKANIAQMFRGIVDKVFPDGPFKDSLKSTGNPVLDESIKQTRFLERIANAVDPSGASGIGYNPTMGGGSIMSRLPNLFGGGGSGMGPGGTANFNPFGGSGSYSSALGGGLAGQDITGTGVDIYGNSTGGSGSGGGSFMQQLGGMFGGGLGKMFGPRKNMLTGKMSGMAGTMGGIGDIASMAGGMIGGRWGNLISMAGTGMSIGANFGPWGAAIGGAIGGVAGLVMALMGGDDANKKIKEAAISQYGITIKDKSVLNSLKQLGEQYFGKGKAGANAVQLVQTDEAKNILRNYAEATGQSGTKIDILSHGDENWSGNQFRGRFGGFRAMGGPVTAGMSYIVGERRPELFTPSVNGTILPAVPNTTTTNGADSRQMAMLADSIAMLAEQVGRLQTVSAGKLLQMGVDENPKAVRDGYERELHADPRSTRSLNELTGSII